MSEVPRDQVVFAICQEGIRSLRAAPFLKQVGIVNVVSVRGGTEAWRDDGKMVSVEATSLARPRIAESEWTHAGALSYSI